MRKNDLIKLLNELEGNPEVVLWNGLVQDYMHIRHELVRGDLVKQTFDHYVEMIRIEHCIDIKNWDFQFSPDEIKSLKQSYRKYVNWEDNQFVSREDVSEKRYSSKTVVYIQPKLRGETFYDRIGNISY